MKTPPASLHVYPSFLVYLLSHSQLVDLKRCSHNAPHSSTLVLGKAGQMDEEQGSRFQRNITLLVYAVCPSPLLNFSQNSWKWIIKNEPFLVVFVSVQWSRDRLSWGSSIYSWQMALYLEVKKPRQCWCLLSAFCVTSGEEHVRAICRQWGRRLWTWEVWGREERRRDKQFSECLSPMGPYIKDRVSVDCPAKYVEFIL